jgi:RNA polymerase sigma-70 factor (ECF subfamily)
LADTNTYRDDNEKELLAQIAAGDTKAFALLFDQYQNKVFSHALTFVKSVEEAEELTTDIFMKIWEHRQQLPAIQNFKSYLFILGRNYLVSAIRKKIMATVEIPSGHLLENILLPDKQYDVKEMHNIIMQGIEKLSVQQKKVFTMSRLEGLSYEEIAMQLAISKRTVKFHMILALNFLREYARYYRLYHFLIWGFIFLLKK